MDKINIEQYRDIIKKKSKYGNKKTLYNGVLFDSKKEADYCQTLDILKKSKNIKEKVISYERQVVFPIYINSIKICKYIADFVVIYSDRKEIIDCKGFKTNIYKLKKKMFEAFYNKKIIEI